MSNAELKSASRATASGCWLCAAQNLPCQVLRVRILGEQKRGTKTETERLQTECLHTEIGENTKAID